MTLEFAILLPAFLALTFSIIEAGWTMSKILMLESATDKTVRELRIGRAAGFTHDYIKARICARSYILVDCEESLVVELSPIAVGAPLPDEIVCVDRGLDQQPERSVDAGERGELVFLRVCVHVDPLTPGLGLGLELDRDGQGGYFLATQTAFLNEPE